MIEALKYHLRDLAVTFRFGETVSSVEARPEGALVTPAPAFVTVRAVFVTAEAAFYRDFFGLPVTTCPYAGIVRLVSLLPSATEIVYALGLGDDLAGVTFECDEPPTARAEKTIVVGGLDTSGMTPGDIDRYVHAQLASGQDLYTLHADALAGFKGGA